ncbi:hypothetical protein SBA4_530005 [Candidatus Sulfopaludibacter sp. SbA4]|nr:hypothetical protein SBA4_530005 [Candidatus Sulfopaludibacter sp. SbA4]
MKRGEPSGVRPAKPLWLVSSRWNFHDFAQTIAPGNSPMAKSPQLACASVSSAGHES